MQLVGIRAVSEALRAGRGIERVVIVRGAKNRRLQPIVEQCRQRGIPLRFEPREAVDRLGAGQSHQEVVAVVAQQGYVPLAQLIAKHQRAGLLVVLDGVEDPHNLGAIIRSAHAAGADGVVIPERRAAGLTEAVGKAAAGALEYLPVARVKNITRALQQLKEKGFWVYGLDERGEKSCDEVDYRGAVALVFGGEGRGLHRLTAERCDALVRIPVAGRIASLNVSVAAGIVLFEALRQRRRQQ